MKKMLLLLTVVCALFAGFAHAAPIDIAINGGFESGNFYGWTLFPSPAGVIEVITPGAMGNSEYACRVYNATPATTCVIKNANLLVLGEDFAPGAEVVISFDAKGMGMVGGVAFAELFSEIEGGGTSSSEILGGGPLALSADEWTHFSFTALTGPDTSGGLTVQFAAVTGADDASMMELFIDNLIVAIDCTVSTEASTLDNIKTLYR